jgi:predicted AAA+ superfamily ATPase
LLAGRAFVYNLYPFRYFLEVAAQMNGKPKFYFFDTGVVRALRNILNVSLEESTSLYGETFEHFISQA